MMTSRKVEKRKIVTNNGVRYIKKRRKLPFVMFLFVLMLSVTMFFGYSKLILAQDDWFGDDFFDDFDTPSTPSTSGGGSSTGGGFGQTSSAGAGEEQDGFDLSETELAKFEVAARIRVKYFNDDPGDDRNHKDPFKPLIERIPQIRQTQVSTPFQVPEERQLPPLNLKLVGVIQAGERFLAMVEFEGKYMELFENDQDTGGNFMVKSITANSISVVSYKRGGELKTFELGR
ncbi:MAG: hypothetical protein WC002_04255 [Candidatus Muiribacteriota bacterium]|jgi:hypothetical protein